MTSFPTAARAPGATATAALFLHDVIPILQGCRQRREHPSLRRVAALLPTACDEKQLRRIVTRLFGVSWAAFRTRHIGLMA